MESDGHSCIQKTDHVAQCNYINVSQFKIEKFAAGCSCQLHKKFSMSSTINIRGQVDLIHTTAYPDGTIGWILHYSDHCNKMMYLRALADKKALTVAACLLVIFLQQDAPLILQSDNGNEFVVELIKEFMELWPECKIVNR